MSTVLLSNRQVRIIKEITERPGQTANALGERLGLDGNIIRTELWRLTTAIKAENLPFERKEVVSPGSRRKVYTYLPKSASTPTQSTLPVDKVVAVVESKVTPTAVPEVVQPTSSTVGNTMAEAVEAVAKVLQPVLDSIISAAVESALQNARQRLEASVQEAVQAIEAEATSLAAKVRTQQATAPFVTVKPASSRAAPAKVAKKIVVVIGAYPELANQIKAEFGDVFDLRVFETNESQRLDRMKSHIQNADAVFMMTRLVGHKNSDIIKAAGTRRIVYVNGAASGLKDALTKFYVEEDDVK